MTSEQVVELLGSIDSGEVTVRRVSEYKPFGNVAYETSNGWKLVIFIDGDDWDYLDSAANPQGEQQDFWGEAIGRDARWVPVQDWRPQHPKLWGTELEE